MTDKTEYDEKELIVSVVKKYYEMGMTQDQIAREEFISKSTVSRLLKKATDKGMVTFHLSYPMDSVRSIERELSRYFNFNDIHIAPTFTNDSETRLKDACRFAAKHLCDMIRVDDILGVGWGISMEQLAEAISTESVTKEKCSKVVMLSGSIAGNVSSSRSSYIVEQFADFFSADGYVMPAPMFVDSEASAKYLMADSHIKYVVDFAKRSRIAVFSLGYASTESVLRKRGILGKKDYDELLSMGAVGDIIGHYYNVEGKPVNSLIDGCIVGLNLNDLRAKEVRIGIAVGNQKARSIIGALRSGVINSLFTDATTAREVIRLMQLADSDKMVKHR